MIMKVIKFKLNNKIFILNEEDAVYYSEDGNQANYIELLDDEIIEFEM